MDQKGKDLLNLMFREGEECCVSPNGFGYLSLPIHRAMGDRVTLISTKYRDGVTLEDGTVRPATMEESTLTCSGKALQLVALNPIRGWRDDASVTAFRSFMVECDDGPLSDQLAYIKGSRIPYSAIVFSGGKSLHVLISLESDLTDEKTWRHVAEWILNVMDKADQKTKNPSRGIRIPGASRGEKKQKLVEFKGKVLNQTLYDWLKQYPDKEPRIHKPMVRTNLQSFPAMKPWMVKALTEGFDPAKGRNQTWFSIGVEFFLQSYDLDTVIEILEEYFVEDRDFKRREWLTTLKSAEKYVSEKK